VERVVVVDKGAATRDCPCSLQRPEKTDDKVNSCKGEGKKTPT